MSEYLNPKLIAEITSQFGPIQELSSPAYEDFSYRVLAYHPEQAHVLIQEVRPGCGSTGFIDYAILGEGKRARRDMLYVNKSRLEPGEIFLTDAKVAFDSGNVRTEYKVEYSQKTDALNVLESYVAKSPAVYMYYLTGRSRLNPLLAHVTFVGDSACGATLSLYDSFDPITEYKRQADIADPDQRGSIVYETYNPNLFGFSFGLPAFDAFGGMLFHANTTGRITPLAWEDELIDYDDSYAYLAKREGSSLVFERRNKQTKTIDRLDISRKVDLEKFGGMVVGRLSEWTTIQNILPVTLSRINSYEP